MISLTNSGYSSAFNCNYYDVLSEGRGLSSLIHATIPDEVEIKV
jgi:hypothetical protein